MTIIRWDLSGAKRKLIALTAALNQVASKEVTHRAANKVADQIVAIATRVTGEHVLSGAASNALAIELEGSKIKLSSIRYMSMHRFWPFRKGMPAVVLKRALETYSTELLATLNGQPTPKGEAWDIATNISAGEHKKHWTEGGRGRSNRKIRPEDV